jgi:hypothetical protein
MNLEGAAGLAMKRLSREGLGWVPTAGNVCTLLAFGICVYLNIYMTGGWAGAGGGGIQLGVGRSACRSLGMEVLDSRSCVHVCRCQTPGAGHKLQLLDLQQVVHW